MNILKLKHFRAFRTDTYLNRAWNLLYDDDDDLEWFSRCRVEYYFDLVPCRQWLSSRHVAFRVHSCNPLLEELVPQSANKNTSACE